MNPLERELKSMRPAGPSRACRERIREALETAAVTTVPGRPVKLRWIGVAAGLAVLVLSAVHLGRMAQERTARLAAAAAGPDDGTVEVLPVSMHREWLGRRDEGVAYVEGLGPVRRYRVRSLDQTEWEIADTGERYWDVQPREHLVFVRANVH